MRARTVRIIHNDNNCTRHFISLSHLQTSSDRAYFDESQRNARAYADEIGVVLRKIPRELLLILKTNDCLRSVDMALGAPINNLVITARYTQAAINAARLSARPTLWTRTRNWVSM